MEREDKPGFLGQLHSFFQNRRLAMIISLIVLAVVLTAGGIATYYLGFAPNAYAVSLDGEEIAKVSSVEVFEEEIAAALATKEQQIGQQVTFTGNIEYQGIRIAQDELTPAEELPQILFQNLNFVTEGAVIKVEGKQEVPVLNEKVAQSVLNEVKNYYVPQDENIKLKEAYFKEKVEVVPKTIALTEILPMEKVKSLIVNGQQEVAVHKVQEGETLWTIARANGLWPEDLWRANPELEGDFLDIGQEIKILKNEPLVHVVAVFEETVKENIPYQTIEKKDSSLYQGQQKVKVAGKAGAKEVKYLTTTKNGSQVMQEVVESKVLEEPVNQVVLKGTKTRSYGGTTMVASRGSGSGVLSWPISGRINSAYGPRGSGYHTGIDIDGRTGDPVFAAASGRVIFAGWSGGYGRMIAIDHGNGLVTRYAHLSNIKVSSGQSVSKGSVIGSVGTTGNTTGSHLHFEVLVNGSFRNPLNYLR